MSTKVIAVAVTKAVIAVTPQLLCVSAIRGHVIQPERIACCFACTDPVLSAFQLVRLLASILSSRRSSEGATVLAL